MTGGFHQVFQINKHTEIINSRSPYSKMASFVRKRMRFDLTKTTLIALRGYRGKPSHEAAPLKDLDIHLEKTEGFY